MKNILLRAQRICYIFFVLNGFPKSRNANRLNQRSSIHFGDRGESNSSRPLIIGGKMHICSFVDVIQSDEIFSKYTLVQLDHERDLFTGEMESYSSTVPEGASAGNSIEGVLKLRDLVIAHLANRANIVIIDHRNENIYSDIQDPVFLRLADNTVYGVMVIDENITIKKIINQAFPDPEKKEERPLKNRCECLLF